MIALQNSPFATYLQEVDTTSLLDVDEERELALRIQEGDVEARDHLIRANLRLVVFFAKKMVNRGLSLDDLIQEGSLGLVRAAEGFDPDRNIRFTTYARYWILQTMQIAVEKMAAPVRVPGYAIDLLTKWKATTAQLGDILGRPPTQDEVVKKLQLKPRQLRIVQKALRIYGSVPNESQEEDAGANLLADSSATPVEALGNSEELSQVIHLLDKLEPRQAAVLRLRFGLDGEGPMILDDIGSRLDLT